MKGLIVENAYIKNKSQISQAERIAGELTALGVEVEIKRNFNLARVADNKVIADKYSFCVFLDKDRVAARLLEKSGTRLFNNACAIEVCDDKMLTNTALANGGFNVPDCIYAPLCYYENAQINQGFLNEVAQKLGFPLVAKINYGSLGAGVSLINNIDELAGYERKNLTSPHFYQKFIRCGSGGEIAGEDIRVIVVSGEVVCAMKRSNKRDFRSNIELGGTGERYECGKKIAKMCVEVAKTLNLDYCGIDVLLGTDGKAYICEVNSNAFFAAAERVCGVNVAGAYARHIVNTVKQ